MPVKECVYVLSDEGAGHGSAKILMLEDDAALAELMRSFLESHSFQVTGATNGVEGLHQTMATDFDVILCDMVMPKLPGDMFYLAVERTKPHLLRRFVFLTGYRAIPKVAEFIRKVNGRALWKPFPMQELLETIQTVLRQNREQNSADKPTQPGNL
jgi:DNA-binding NtrC family response regulator